MKTNVLSRWKESDPLVRYLLLIPAAIVLFIVCSILHNLVYALLILIFGEGFWDTSGIGDEPLFFLMTTIVSPVVLLVGIAGAGYESVKKMIERIHSNKPKS